MGTGLLLLPIRLQEGGVVGLEAEAKLTFLRALHAI